MYFFVEINMPTLPLKAQAQQSRSDVRQAAQEHGSSGEFSGFLAPSRRLPVSGLVGRGTRTPAAVPAHQVLEACSPPVHVCHCKPRSAHDSVW